MSIHAKTIVAAAVLALTAVLFAGAGSAGEKGMGNAWRDTTGITVDSANRNAGLIRRARNRDQRDLNNLNPASDGAYYGTTGYCAP